MTKVNTQERTSRETGLEDIMESMYSEGCGTVHASVKRKKKKVKEQQDDHHNQYMMDQDLLQPIHHAAHTATQGKAKNFNEWMIIQIKEQGDNWVDWFIETVIVEERFRS